MRNDVAVLLMAATAIAALLIFYFMEKPQVTNPSPVMTLSGNEIAVQSSGFIDSLRTDDEYYFIKECVENTTEKDCAIYDFDMNHSNAWPLYAYTSLYKTTGDSSYLLKAKDDIQTLSNYCSLNPDDCLWILVQMIEYQKSINDTKYSSLITDLGQHLLTTSENNSTMLLGIESRELALFYGMNGESKYMDEAKLRLEESKNLWSNTGPDEHQALLYIDNGFSFYGYSCWSELAGIELYQATKNQTYLHNAVNFFDAANLDQHTTKIDQLVALQPCVESLLKLSSITGDQKYRNQAINISQYIVTYRWDPDIQIATKYNGDGGFLSRVYMYDNWKIIPDTSYMIYLLTQMKDVQFQILEWN
jgi:hypothetical protein